MSLSDKITADLKAALKAKDTRRVSCLRMLKTAMKNQQVEQGRELTDEEIQTILSSLVRKGKEAVQEFKQGGREDLASQEEEELAIFYDYLPRQMSEEEIEGVIREIIAELPDKSPKQMGTVMKKAMARMAGQAEGKTVNQIAKKLLS